MKKIIFLTLLSLLLPLAAQAQEDQIFMPPATAYDNRGAAVNKFLKQQSFEKTDKLPVGTLYVSIIHPDYLDPDQFGLMLQKANSENSCFDYTPLEYEANYIENYYMDVTVKHYRRSLHETKYPQFDCDQKSKIVSTMIVFSANDLKKRDLKQIRFNNGSARDTYNIAYTEDSIRLIPDSMIAFKAVGLTGADKNYLEYNFVDNSLITLQVPMAQEGEDVAQAVRDLAYRSALEPVFEQKGIDTSGKNNVFYFKDPSGTTIGQLNEDGYMEYGTINVIRPYDGANGRVGMPIPLKVFLARPNVTL